MKKNKTRYSRSLKRERKRSRDEEAAAATDPLQSPSTTKPKKKRRRQKPTIIDRVEKCLEDAAHTESILIVDGDVVGLEVQREHHHATSVKIMTCSDLRPTKQTADPAVVDSSSSSSRSSSSSTLTVRVQPLLILDLNGVLCHRRRHSKEAAGGGVCCQELLRPSIGVMAETAIIPRTDLQEFLRYLDQHFCLAVWTSAKKKTATRLLKMILPDDDDLRGRLLFVWGQNYCDTISSRDGDNGIVTPNNGDEAEEEDNTESTDEDDHGKDDNDDDDDTVDETIYEKNLNKVWRMFPLWSADNTLLMDDSPEKCSFAVANAIHPPAIHGRTKESAQKGTANTNHSNNVQIMSDEVNERLQREFFQKLVAFWTRQPHTRTLQNVKKKKKEHLLVVQDDILNATYFRFLETNATTHFRWRDRKPNENARSSDKHCLDGSTAKTASLPLKNQVAALKEDSSAGLFDSNTAPEGKEDRSDFSALSLEMASMIGRVATGIANVAGTFWNHVFETPPIQPLPPPPPPPVPMPP